MTTQNFELADLAKLELMNRLEDVTAELPFDVIDTLEWYAEILTYGAYGGDLPLGSELDAKAMRKANRKQFTEVLALLRAHDSKLPDIVNRKFADACYSLRKRLNLQKSILPGMVLLKDYDKLYARAKQRHKKAIRKRKRQEWIHSNALIIHLPLYPVASRVLSQTDNDDAPLAQVCEISKYRRRAV